MGMKNISRISALLIKNGRLPETPAAVVQWATKPNQRTVRGTLDTIADIVEKERLEHPALIIIGDVVGLRQGLNWFEKLPMFGKTIAVTRAADQARSLAEMLNNHGAHVVETPAIRMEPPEDWTEVDRAIEDLPGYRWVVFTSVNGVHAFCERLMARGHDARHFGRCRIAAIGSATADALSRCGLRADFVPGKYTSAALAEGLKDTAGQKVLLARADIGTPALNSALEEKGARVTDVAVYRTLPAEFDAGELETLLSKGKLQGITFTSASTVRSILAKAGPSLLKAGNCALFSIGPETSAALGEAGLAPAREAVEHTIPGLVAAILEYFRDPEEGSHD
jgi:uroporphyrinogen III methyltransferase/synthase